MTRDDALEKLRAVLPEVRRTFAVKSLALFGSVARGEAGPDSDVDLLVEFDLPQDYFSLFDLQERLSAAMGRPVDLVTRNAVHRALKARIFAEAVNA
jgi:predicted nucleotidyltransferase